jgi:hypothetical protein
LPPTQIKKQPPPWQAIWYFFIGTSQKMATIAAGYLMFFLLAQTKKGQPLQQVIWCIF